MTNQNLIKRMHEIDIQIKEELRKVKQLLIKKKK